MLHAGHEFAPGYRLEAFLGKGQFGQVWRVTAPGETAAAVKFIDLSMGEGQKEYTAIRRVKAIRHANLMPITAIWLLNGQGKAIAEASPDAASVQATLDLSDPRAAAQETKAIDVIDDTESRYMAVAMLLGGKNLLDHMRECQAEGHVAIPAKQLLRYIEEAAKGLDFLNSAKHDLGEGPIAIQHCDVKPANIVLLGDSAVVCDFGLARILSRAQVTATSAVGTPAYMAPEAIEGRPSSTTDQYALAVTYYQLRTGDLPMASGSMWEILDAHRMGKLDLRGVPPAEQAVLRKATALDWQQRFPTSIEMAEALRDAVARPNQSTREIVGAVDATIDFGSAIDISSHVDNSAPPTIELAADETESVRGMTGAVEDGAAASGRALPAPLQQLPVPVMLAAAGAVLLVLLGLSSLVWFGNDVAQSEIQDDVQTNGNGGGASVVREGESVSPEVQPVEEKSANELLTDAMALLGSSDVDVAAKQFLAAAQLDPSLRQPQPTVMPLGLSGVERVRWVGNRGLIVAADLRGGLRFIDVDRVLDVDQEPGLAAEADQPVHSAEITAIEVSPDGAMVVTASYDKSVAVWSLEGDAPRCVAKLLGFDTEVEAIALHPNFSDEPYVVSATFDQRLYVHHVDLGSQSAAGAMAELKPDGYINLESEGRYAVGFTPDAQRVLILDDKEQLVDVSWQELLEDVRSNAAPRPQLVTPGVRTRLFITANLGTAEAQQPVVITGSPEGPISAWEFSGGKYSQFKRLVGHEQQIEMLKYCHAAGRHLLLSGSSDQTARLWNLQTGGQLGQLAEHAGPVTAGSFSADGHWAASCGGETLVQLHYLDGTQRSAGFNTGTYRAKFVEIDPRGKWFVAVTEQGELYRWELPRVQLITLTEPMLEDGPAAPTPVPPPNADPPEPSQTGDSVAAL